MRQQGFKNTMRISCLLDIMLLLLHIHEYLKVQDDGLRFEYFLQK